MLSASFVAGTCMAQIDVYIPDMLRVALPVVVVVVVVGDAAVVVVVVGFAWRICVSEGIL